ncbi:MAG: hypothetical protein RLZZ418_282 [Pseudomonadota bacterium]|jgi:thymidylate synthase (FAD)
MPKIISKELDKILDQEFKILDHGFIRIVDYMGDDSAIVQAARVSYGAGTKKVSEDKGLINYLMRMAHSTPFEMCEIKFHIKCPIFVARQWLRHRSSSCLSGDSVISFDLPSGVKGRPYKHYGIKILDLYKKFQPTNNKRKDKQLNPFYKRDRVQKMKLRYYSVLDKEIKHTSLIDIWSNGIKKIFALKLQDGSMLKLTADHLLFTNIGWVKAEEAYKQNLLIGIKGNTQAKKPQEILYSIEELQNEKWKFIKEYDDRYEISNLGRIRSWYTHKNTKRSEPIIKKATIGNAGYKIIGLSKNSKTSAFQISRLLMKTFDPLENMDDLEVRHLDSNSLNDRLSNLKWGTSKENTADKFTTGCSQYLTLVFTSIKSFVYLGEEEVFDLEVEAKDHNFFANNICVHNCNEYSARYSIVDNEYYVPEINQIAIQSLDNKQGRGEKVNSKLAGKIACVIKSTSEQQYKFYTKMLEKKIARETARGSLTLNYYTEFYWKINLHNLMHFLKLRADSHAQYEIRVYALQIIEFLKVWVPHTYEAFINYKMEADNISKKMKDVVKRKIKGENITFETSGLNKREWNEFELNYLSNV